MKELMRICITKSCTLKLQHLMQLKYKKMILRKLYERLGFGVGFGKNFL
jgi:hypothetical protein